MAARLLLAFAVCAVLIHCCQAWLPSSSQCQPIPDDQLSPAPTIPRRTKVRLARFSVVSFVKRGNELETWQCKLCKQHLSNYTHVKFKTDPNLETLAFTGYDPILGGIVIVHRGTLTALNWLNNFHFVKKNSGIYPPEAGQLHTGFLDMYLSLRSGVLADVDNLISLYPSAPIYFTGLSLGGSLAALGALDVKLRHPAKSPIMVSFGAPRIGDTCFANFYNERVTQSLRVINKNDMVVYLPPSWLGFCHVAHEEVVSLSFYHGEHYGVDAADVLLNNDKRKRRALQLLDDELAAILRR